MKKIIKIVLLISIALVCCGNLMAQSCENPWNCGWQGCNGDGSIPEECYYWAIKNGITKENSNKLKAGMYEIAEGLEVYFSEEEIIYGFCAVRDLKLGRIDDLPELCTQEGEGSGYCTFEIYDCYIVIVDGEKRTIVPFAGSITKFEEMTICQGDTAIWRGSKYTTPGIHQMMYIAGERECDSLFLLHLDVTEPELVIEEHQICEGDTLSIYGKKFTTEDTHYIWADEPCESNIAINLDLRKVEPVTVKKDIEFGEIYEFRDSVMTKSGSYSFPPTSSWAPCTPDTIIDLSVKKPSKCERCRKEYKAAKNIEVSANGGYGRLPFHKNLILVKGNAFVYGTQLSYMKDISLLEGECSLFEIGGNLGIMQQSNDFGDPAFCDCFNFSDGSPTHVYIQPMIRWSYTGWCKKKLILSLNLSLLNKYHDNGYEEISNFTFTPVSGFELRKYFGDEYKPFIGLEGAVFHTSLLKPSYYIGFRTGMRLFK